MLTQNQQEIINSITKEFLSFNEQRKVVSKPFNLFNTSHLDASNEYSKEQIEEARIVNRSISKTLAELLVSDFSLLKQDVPKLPIQLSKWMGDGWDGNAQYERENRIGRIIIGTGFIVDYFAHGKRYTADNGDTYVILDGTYRLHVDDYSGVISASTLADLFANDRFVQKFTKFYREFIK